MLASPRIINCIRTATNSWRYFGDVFRQELTVQTFCDLQVNLPYNVHIKPLDVHKYHNCDLLKIEVTGANSVEHVQDGSTIKIFGPNQDHDANTTCTIDAPVKANLNVEALGDIRTGVFGGSKLILKSLKGSIFVDKYQGDTIDLNTESGDIDLQGAVVASTIKVVVTKNGVRVVLYTSLNKNCFAVHQDQALAGFGRGTKHKQRKHLCGILLLRQFYF
jgi:hypothetical protein